MVNFYFVQDGEIKTRYGDVVPATYIDPRSGLEMKLAGLSAGDLAVLGWIEGIPTDAMPFDSETEKSYIVPVVPAYLEEFAKAWKEGPRDKLEIPKVIEQWVVEPLSDEELTQRKNQLFQQVRWTRNAELMRTDVLMLADSPVVGDPLQFAQWKAYRQALRDLPSTADDPMKVKWPVPPDGISAKPA